jgi:polyisoprenoid-binding protein YceI
MKKTLLTLMASLFLLNVNAQTATWKTDPTHSNVKFTVTHLVVSEMDGHFKNFEGTLTSAKPDFSDAQIEFTVDVASVNTENADRDAHLKSDEFFNADKYPKMTFKSTSVKKTGENKYDLEGDLTIRDVTKRVKFEVTGGKTILDPWGNTKAGFRATTTINRQDYGLKWSKATETGGLVVGDEVVIMLNISMLKQKK